MRSLCLLLFIGLLLPSCEKVSQGGGGASNPTTAAGAPAAPAPAPAPGIAVTSAGSKADPHAGMAGGSKANGAGISGVVLEKIDAAKYTYLRLDGTRGKQWAAVPQAQVSVGQRVQVVNAMLMRGFHSKTLKREFAEIYFGTLSAAAPPKTPILEPNQLNQAHRGVVAEKDPIKVGEPIPRAKGGNTVAEIYQRRAALAGKKVIVRGKVVKVNNGIMGRNWAHLQDGSRNGEADFDLTITTQTKLKVGQVIEVSGTLAVDRDFGAGYRYPIILEKATLRQ